MDGGALASLVLDDHGFTGSDRGTVACLTERRSAVEHRPADVVAQPLVVEDELADRPRQLVALPLALASPCGLASPSARLHVRP